MIGRLGLVVVLAAGCVRSDAVQCGDKLCAPGTVCDVAHQGCVLPIQFEACAMAKDGDRCTAGTLEAICDQGVCVPGCGDGVQGVTFAGAEECDDGNLASHDSCSSVCTLEAASWERWESSWQPRARHAAAYMPTLDLFVVVGGADESAVTDDHWERAGKEWRLRPDTLPHPSARMGAAIAYDPHGRRIVLFGGTPDLGTDTAEALGDTWVFDGTAWRALTPTQAPSARWAASMAYAGGRIVLFGGREPPETVLGDTWELLGEEWVKIPPTGLDPPGRYDATMASVPGADPCCVMLVAGRGESASGGRRLLADAWQYQPGTGWTPAPTPPDFPARDGASLARTPDGSRLLLVGGQTASGVESRTFMWSTESGWSEVSASVRPPARMLATLTTVTDAVVLIGGRTGNEPLDDIWSFGSGWARESAPSGPLPRGEHELVLEPESGTVFSLGGSDRAALDLMATFDGETWTTDVSLKLASRRLRFASAFDGMRDRIVIFGGTRGTESYATSTESWTGRAWEPVAGREPPPRRNGALAFDAGENRLVLFGGEGETGAARGDTWTLATGWTDATSAGPEGPAASARAAMAYDRAGARLVLVDEAGVTWTWAEGVWSLLTRVGPSPRRGAAMTYSPELRRLVLYGGVDVTTNTILRDVWRLDGEEWKPIAVEGSEPPLRRDPRVANLPALRALVLHGGTAPSGAVFDDTWLFQYRSELPDENCINGIDDDGDKRVDADDPDCD